MHLWRVLASSNGAAEKGLRRWIRVRPLELCVAIVVLSTVLAGHSAAQANEPAVQPAQEPAPSSEPQAAQPPTAPLPTTPPQPRVPATRRRPTIDDHVKALAKSLNLTEAQQAAVKRILEQRQQETLRLRTDGSISGSERIDRFRALQDQTVLKIRGVLDDEQKKKYDPLAVRKVTPAPDQKSVEDWIKATSPK